MCVNRTNYLINQWDHLVRYCEHSQLLHLICSLVSDSLGRTSIEDKSLLPALKKSTSIL
jgi:hypothetical protein